MHGHAEALCKEDKAEKVKAVKASRALLATLAADAITSSYFELQPMEAVDSQASQGSAAAQLHRVGFFGERPACPPPSHGGSYGSEEH